MMSSESCDPGRPERATTREWAGLALLVVPMLVLATDLTVLFLALPTIATDLGATATQGLWIVHVYGFMVAGFLVTMGRLGDKVGPRKLLMIGSAAFAALSVLAAFSASPVMLIIARALLGVAGATLMPSLFSLLRVMFRNSGQRRLAIAILFSAFSLGGAVGPLLGGALLEFFWWGSVFLINVPPILLMLIAGRLLLPERRTNTPARLDLPSVALSVTAILAIVYGLQELAAGGGTAGGGSNVLDLVVILFGAAVLAAFLHRQRTLRDPLFDLALLADRRIAASLAALLLVGIGVVGVFYLVTQYLQWVFELSPLHAGLWTLPYIGVNIGGALLAPTLAARLRPEAVAAGGLVIAALGLTLVALIAGSPPLSLVAALSVTGFGQGLALALVSDLVISNSPPEQTGSAAAAQEISGELGTAVGIAAGGAIGMLVYRTSLHDHLPPEIPEAAARAAQPNVYDGVATAERLDSHGPALLDAVHAATTHGLQVYAGVGAMLVSIAAVLVAAVLIGRRSTSDPRHTAGRTERQA